MAYLLLKSKRRVIGQKTNYPPGLYCLWFSVPCDDQHPLELDNSLKQVLTRHSLHSVVYNIKLTLSRRKILFISKISKFIYFLIIENLLYIIRHKKWLNMVLLSTIQNTRPVSANFTHGSLCKNIYSCFIIKKMIK